MTKPRSTWLPLLTLLALLAVASVSCGPGGDPPPPIENEVEVRIIVDGPGRVIQGPVPYECRDDCLWTGDGDVNTSFLAVPAPEYAFVGWEGVCDVLENPCTRTFEDGDTIKATFALHALRLDLTGDGQGAFRILGGDVDTTCDVDCALGLDRTLLVAVTAAATSGTTLDEAWSGPCDPATVDSDYCLVEISGLTTVGKTWRHPPVAADEAYDTTRNAALTVAAPGVLANDDDTPGDVLSANVVSDPQHGSLTLGGNGGFTYAPAGGYVGTDGFRYRVRDAFGNQDTADVVITVTNRAPAAANETYGADHDTALVVAPAQGVLANDTDPDGDTLTATLVGDVANGTLAFAADGSFSYTPDLDFAGVDIFTYTASDGIATSNTATVTIAVGNEAPTAVDDAYDATGAGTLVVDAGTGVLANDEDLDGDALTATLVDGVAFGDLVLAADGSFSYTPTAGNPGTDTFTYTASDGIATSNTATVTITVTNGAPVAANDAYGTTRNATLTIAAPGVLGDDSDPDGDSLSAAVVDDVENGTLTFDPNGGFSYTPDTGYVGNDTFTYTASDGIATSNTATVTITVANQAPTAVNNAYGTTRNATVTITAPGVLGNDSDPNGDPLTANLVNDVSNGTLTFNANGSFSYTPDTNYVGNDTFAYTANDGIATSNTATVTITITNQAPVAANNVYATAVNAPLDVPAPGVLANDSDPNGDTLTANLVNGVSNGTLTLNANGSFSYTPDTNYVGNDTFTYAANDGIATSNTATVTISVEFP